MKTIEINDRDRQMLELLALGSSNRSIAESLGYREGTMRVYLHGLYRKLGVGNKTSAVIWYFDRLKGESETAGTLSSPQACAPLEESFGDLALRTSPHGALGAMTMFLGAYSRTWEVAQRLKGAAVDERASQRRQQSRLLWEAMLKGDFGYGKQLYDADLMARLLVDSPSDCVLLGCLLRIGGYSRAADRVLSQLTKRKKGRIGISTRELTMLGALREAMEGRSADGLSGLYRLATESTAKPLPRHAAIVALYWAYRSQKDLESARATANALWAEAESARQQLLAMGERPLDPKASVPSPSATRKAKTSRATASKGASARAALVE